MDRGRTVGFALVVASACAFGSGGLFAKPAYAAGVDWLVLSAWRFLLGATLGWAWLLVSASRRAALRRMARREFLVAVGLGALYVGNSGTYYAGLETVPLSLAALIVYLYPPLVAVLALRFGRRLSGARAWTALGMALLGVTLAVGGIDTRAAPAPEGVVLLLFSPVIYAVWIILSARLSGERRGRVGDEAGEGVDASTAAALMMSATAAVFWAIALGSGRPVLPGSIPVDAWGGLLGIGILSTFVAIVGFYAGARRVGAAQAALISTVEPLWTISLATLLLAESLAPLQLVGGALILTGVILAQTSRAEGAAERAVHPTLRVADE